MITGRKISPFVWLRLNFRDSLAKPVAIVIQPLSQVQLFATPWTAACQASLSFRISQSLLKLMSIEPVMPSNHLILCHPFLLLPSVFPSIRVFSSNSVICIRWPKCWRFCFSISHFSEYSVLIIFRLFISQLIIFQQNYSNNAI